MATPLPSLLRTSPVPTLLLGCTPIALAALQLLNAHWHGGSILPAIGFAVAMVGFAVLATGHLAAVERLEHLDPEFRN